MLGAAVGVEARRCHRRSDAVVQLARTQAVFPVRRVPADLQLQEINRPRLEDKKTSDFLLEELTDVGPDAKHSTAVLKHMVPTIAWRERTNG